MSEPVSESTSKQSPARAANRNARFALAGLAAVVVIGVVVMLVAVRKSGGQSEPTVRAPASAPGVVPSESGRTARPEVHAPVTRRRTDGEVRTSVNDDGVVVRDHRRKGAPEVRAPIRVPVSAGKMNHLTIAAVRNALRPIVRRCEREHVPEIDGDKPQLQAVVQVSVEGDRVLAGETEVSVRGAQADALMECVKRGAADIDIPAKGHPEIANYALTFPFRLGRRLGRQPTP